jgi:hypothetical protein
MSQNNRQYRGATVAEFIPQDQLEEIKKFALGPQTLEGKLALYAKYATEHEVANPKDPKRKDRRSRLGSFINKMFNTELVLPSTGRRQQIGKAIKFGKEYLQDHSDVSVYYAAAMGAAMEYREWMACVGGLSEAQQLAVLNNDQEIPA